MSTLEIDVGDLRARLVDFTATELVVTLVDGRRIATPLERGPSSRNSSGRCRPSSSACRPAPARSQGQLPCSGHRRTSPATRASRPEPARSPSTKSSPAWRGRAPERQSLDETSRDRFQAAPEGPNKRRHSAGELYRASRAGGLPFSRVRQPRRRRGATARATTAAPESRKVSGIDRRAPRRTSAFA